VTHGGDLPRTSGPLLTRKREVRKNRRKREKRRSLLWRGETPPFLEESTGGKRNGMSTALTTPVAKAGLRDQVTQKLYLTINTREAIIPPAVDRRRQKGLLTRVSTRKKNTLQTPQGGEGKKHISRRETGAKTTGRASLKEKRKAS